MLFLTKRSLRFTFLHFWPIKAQLTVTMPFKEKIETLFQIFANFDDLIIKNDHVGFYDASQNRTVFLVLTQVRILSSEFPF